MEESERKVVWLEAERDSFRRELAFKTEQCNDIKRQTDKTVRTAEEKVQVAANDVDNTKREATRVQEEAARMMSRIQELERERNMAVEEAMSVRAMHAEKLQEANED